MTDIVLANPADKTTVTVDWNDDLVAGLTIVSVVHTLPSPLIKDGEVTNAGAGQSQVTFHGAVHGKIYQILGAATLSDGDVINRRVPVRGWDS